MKFFISPKTKAIHKVPRQWSNAELQKFAHLFTGDVVNVSGWEDADKQGRKYKDYFVNAKTYRMTNFKENMRGWQGVPGEIFLDLERPLSSDLKEVFDVVFNHTTLEHVYNVQVAMDNLCEMARDIVILIVPFLQQMHGTYGDYWRFTPESVVKMFESRGLSIAYLSFNNHKRASVYIFCIATKNPAIWKEKFPFSYSFEDKGSLFLQEPYAGCNAFRLPVFLEVFHGFSLKIKRSLDKLKNKVRNRKR